MLPDHTDDSRLTRTARFQSILFRIRTSRLSGIQTTGDGTVQATHSTLVISFGIQPFVHPFE